MQGVRTMSQIFKIVAAMAVPGLLAGCAPPTHTLPANVPFSSLSGTSWELVELHIAADGQGSRIPGNPANYTIAFRGDGTAAMQLDCNRGNGPWRNDISNATGGTLAIGPLAVTKALCSEPTLGEDLEMAIGRVRNFTVMGGRLTMRLVNDSDVIVWRENK